MKLHSIRAPRRSGRLRPISAVAVVTAASLLALAGCGGSSSDDSEAGGTVNLTFFTIPVNSTPVIEKVVERFEETHPGIKVKVELGPNNVDTVRGTLATQISSGSSTPDVYEGDVMWPAQFAEENLALNLSDHIDGDFFDTFQPALAAQGQVDGNQYMTPWFTEAGYLYYRKDLLEEAGLPVPKTWEELAETAAKIQASGKAKYGYVFQGATTEELTCNWVEYLTDAGGQVVNDDYTEGTMNTPAGVKALSFMRSLIDTGVTPKAVTTFQSAESLSAFDAGDAVFMRNWGYAYAITQDKDSSDVVGKVGMAPLPTFEGSEGPGASVVGGGNLYINPNTDHLEESLEFLQWLGSDEAQKIMATVGEVLPVTTAVADDPEIQQVNEPMSVLPDLRLASRQVATPKYPGITQAVYRAVNSALAGGTSIEEALAQADKEINSALQGSL
ncbi:MULTISPECIES: ABC transporter substrate-binding protein [unclassified Nocardioides]|uniref:ABC transporter substrate-binding protein n=1 Tax=unclassified Nocardioides TaxID=2615069 RepID=UPI0009F00BF4|nr:MULTISPECIES: ABC transporter substrate-binding protein [unclassified Nocardioides]GAW50936.1 Extracellular solute-binding protein family 1 [Nocardioides sp. PD653-B2]GAW56337.1 Extracellular solute-binding protein family 1 [Nocardioides sp. PD653]